jgi:hypothetical protein
VLVALAILGTAVVVSIQGVSQGLRLLKAAGDQQQAIIVADHKARELLVPTEGSESGTDGRFSWQRTARVVETPELTLANAAQKWRVFEISVVVTWGEQRRLEVSTLRTVPATSDPTQSGEPLAQQGSRSGQQGSQSGMSGMSGLGNYIQNQPSSRGRSTGSGRSTSSQRSGGSSQ